MAYKFCKMKAAIKIALWLATAVGLVIAIVAGLSSASEWFILLNHGGYQREDFVVIGTRMSPSSSDNGSDYYLRGTTKDNEFEFAIDASDYERFSPPHSKSKVVQIYRNPELLSVAFQKRSLNVIFAEEWRDASELEVSARSTLWIAIFSLLISIVFWLTAKLALPPILNRNAQPAAP
jgi:hypothetical protein